MNQQALGGSAATCSSTVGVKYSYV
jgi:hypothetical protein